MALLTDQILATAVTKNSLIHIVNTTDVSQNPAGSSFKAALGQVASAISGLTTPDLETVLNQGNITGANDIIIPTNYKIVGDLGFGYFMPQDSFFSGITLVYDNTIEGGDLTINDTFLRVGYYDGTYGSNIQSDGYKIQMGNNGGYYIAKNAGIQSGLTISPLGELYIENLQSGNTICYLGLTSSNAVVTGSTQKNWGSFISTVDQSISVAGTTYKMSADTTTGSSNVTLSGGSKFVVSSAGVYNIQFSAQINKSSGTQGSVWIWLSRGGTPIPSTNTEVYLNGGSNERTVAAWNWVDECDAGAYYQIEWTADHNNVYLDYIASPTYGPAIPSLIVTITQV